MFRNLKHQISCIAMRGKGTDKIQLRKFTKPCHFKRKKFCGRGLAGGRDKLTLSPHHIVTPTKPLGSIRSSPPPELEPHLFLCLFSIRRMIVLRCTDQREDEEEQMKPIIELYNVTHREYYIHLLFTTRVDRTTRQINKQKGKEKLN